MRGEYETDENNETNEKFGKFHRKSKLVNSFNTKGQRVKGSKKKRVRQLSSFDPLTL